MKDHMSQLTPREQKVWGFSVLTIYLLVIAASAILVVFTPLSYLGGFTLGFAFLLMLYLKIFFKVIQTLSTPIYRFLIRLFPDS